MDGVCVGVCVCVCLVTWWIKLSALYSIMPLVLQFIFFHEVWVCPTWTFFFFFLNKSVDFTTWKLYYIIMHMPLECVYSDIYIWIIKIQSYKLAVKPQMRTASSPLQEILYFYPSVPCSLKSICWSREPLWSTEDQALLIASQYIQLLVFNTKQLWRFRIQERQSDFRMWNSSLHLVCNIL